MIEIEDKQESVPVCVTPWEPEINFFKVLTQFISALQGRLNEADWKLSPAKAYELLSLAIWWASKNRVHGWDNPAWAVVSDMLSDRADALLDTSINGMLEQEMTEWKNRPRPSAYHVLERFDWYLPLFRRAVSILDRELADGDVTASGRPLTIGEAVGVVFEFVDWCSKHPYFKQRSPWGWWQTVEWLDFVRDELKDLRDELKDETSFDPGQSVGNLPFSYPGG